MHAYVRAVWATTLFFWTRNALLLCLVCTGCHEAMFGRGVRNHQAAYDRCVMNSDFLALITDDMDGVEERRYCNERSTTECT